MGAVVSFFTAVDMFAEKIQFTYNQRDNFPTFCGGIMTVLSMLVIVFYLVYFILISMQQEFPMFLNNMEVFKESPRFTIDSDSEMKKYEGSEFLYGYGPEVSPPKVPYPKFSEDDKENSFFFQMAIGLLYDGEFVSIDPTIFGMQIRKYHFNKLDPNEETRENKTDLHYKKCKRFHHFSKDEVEYFKIPDTYCIYDTFELEGSELSEVSKHVQIKIYKCVNGTEENIICKSNEEISDYLNYLKVYLFYTRYSFDNTDTRNTLKVVMGEFVWELLAAYTKRINFYLSADVLNSYDSILPDFLTDHVNTYHAFGFQNSFDQLEKYSEVDRAVFRIYLRAFNARMIYERKYNNILDILGIVGGMSRIVTLIFGGLVFYIAGFKYKESMVNNFYSLIDPQNKKFLDRNFDEYLLCKFYYFNFVQQIENNSQLMKVVNKYKGDNLENGINTFFNKEKIKYIFGLFLNISERSYGNVYENVDFNFVVEQGHINNKTQFVNVKEIDFNKCFKEILKYQIIYDLMKTSSYDKVYFNFCELLFKLTLCKCCMTRNFIKKNQVFEKACSRLKEDINFINIIKSTKELTIFKNIFFTDDQNKLFKYAAKKPVTIEDTDYDKARKKKEKFNQSHIKSFYTKVSYQNEGSDEKKENHANKEENEDVAKGLEEANNVETEFNEEKEYYEDFLKAKELDLALSSIIYKDDATPYNLALMRNLNVSSKIINELFKENEFSVRKNLDEYSEIFEIILDFRKKKIDDDKKSVISHKSARSSAKSLNSKRMAVPAHKKSKAVGINIELNLLKKEGEEENNDLSNIEREIILNPSPEENIIYYQNKEGGNLHDVDPVDVSLDFMNEKDLQEKINKQFGIRK